MSMTWHQRGGFSYCYSDDNALNTAFCNTDSHKVGYDGTIQKCDYQTCLDYTYITHYLCHEFAKYLYFKM